METNLRQLAGNWDLGYALDKHVVSSVMTGHNAYGYPTFDTERTPAGEALYQLKNKQAWPRAGSLAEELATAIFPRFDHVGLLIPMPASRPRPRQPVTFLTEVLGKLTTLPVFDNLLSKTTSGPQLKDLQTKAEKVAALNGSFSVDDGINGHGPWNVLLVDDLYDTGASLEGACKVLRTYPKIAKIYVATVTWK
jgi:predicted amidophosphoribosyltransferase